MGKKHCVYCLNYTGIEVNEQTVMLLRVLKDKHLQKACGNLVQLRLVQKDFEH